jgi:hypothetical protein
MSSFEILEVLKHLERVGALYPGEKLRVELGRLAADGARFLPGVAKDKFAAWFTMVGQFDKWSSKSSCWHPFRRLNLSNGVHCDEQRVFPYTVYTRVTKRLNSPEQVLLAAPEAPFACRVTAASESTLKDPTDLGLRAAQAEVQAHHNAGAKGVCSASQTLVLGKRYRFTLGCVEWEFSIEQEGSSMRDALANERLYMVRMAQALPDTGPVGAATCAKLFEKVRDFFGRPTGPRVPQVSSRFLKKTLRARALPATTQASLFPHIKQIHLNPYHRS